MHDGDDLNTLVRAEIEDLHQFFVAWFTGAAPASEAHFRECFDARFDAQSIIIPPEGSLLAIADLRQVLFGLHASNPAFSIAIRKVVVQRQEGDSILATYEEWQRNALNSEPADNARVSSVLLRREAQRLRWLHIHETWLPADAIAAGDFDF